MLVWCLVSQACSAPSSFWSCGREGPQRRQRSRALTVGCRWWARAPCHTACPYTRAEPPPLAPPASRPTPPPVRAPPSGSPASSASTFRPRPGAPRRAARGARRWQSARTGQRWLQAAGGGAGGGRKHKGVGERQAMDGGAGTGHETDRSGSRESIHPPRAGASAQRTRAPHLLLSLHALRVAHAACSGARRGGGRGRGGNVRRAGPAAVDAGHTTREACPPVRAAHPHALTQARGKRCQLLLDVRQDRALPRQLLQAGRRHGRTLRRGRGAAGASAGAGALVDHLPAQDGAGRGAGGASAGARGGGARAGAGGIVGRAVEA